MLKTAVTLFLSAALATVACGLPGCDAPQPNTPQADTMAAATRALKIFPRQEGGQDNASIDAFIACRTELTRLGYTTISNRDDADVVARIESTLAEEASLLTVKVNGQRRVSYRVSTQVIIEGMEGSTIFLGNGAYSSGDDDGPATMAKTLIGRLHQSGKLAAYASQLQHNREALALKAEQKKKEQQEAEEAEKQRVENEAKRKEDALWQASNSAGCAEPLTQTACDGVREYIKAYPAGRYTARARQALQFGEVRIQALLIENDWKAIDRGRCEAPKATSDCTPLQAHLDRFPGSPHADEARAILGKVDKKLQELAKAEKKKADAEEAQRKREEAAAEARRKREDAAEEARQKRETAAEEAKAKAEAMKACQEQCKDACIDWRTGGVRGPCLARCVARDCR